MLQNTLDKGQKAPTVQPCHHVSQIISSETLKTCQAPVSIQPRKMWNKLETRLMSKQATRQDKKVAIKSERKKSAEKDVSKTQIDSDSEEVTTLIVPIRLDHTQRSISQKVDDSADTGEFVDELSEDRERSDSE
ncbi:unnamed protein product [Thelazia callipaeda]|uniref:BLVR domain-containing protein n=1 Tax=Thelazia callipaeda TaxID=103827 RepID=A0A0N5D157_THECL|nr:unnamed protein product [Thelazia callipaeda]